MFFVGQKVVCLETPMDLQYLRYCVNLPQENQVYTVRGFDHVGDDEGIWLSEIVNPVTKWINAEPCEQAFHVTYFRPLVEKSTDTGMAILREILDRETISDLGSPVVTAPSNEEGVVPK